ELERCRRYRAPFALAIADVDHFKQVNDTLSHAVGDQTLRRVAELMNEELRQSDLLARYGGAELVPAFPERAPARARDVSARHRARAERSAVGADRALADLRAHEVRRDDRDGDAGFE